MWVAQLPRAPPPSGVTGDSRHPGLPHPGNSRPHPGQLTPGRAIYLVHKLHKLMHYISNLCITYLTLFVSLCAVAHKVAPRTPEGYLYVVGFRSQV